MLTSYRRSYVPHAHLMPTPGASNSFVRLISLGPCSLNRQFTRRRDPGNLSRVCTDVLLVPSRTQVLQVRPTIFPFLWLRTKMHILFLGTAANQRLKHGSRRTAVKCTPRSPRCLGTTTSERNSHLKRNRSEFKNLPLLHIGRNRCNGPRNEVD